jgi:hypothetical protein
MNSAMPQVIKKAFSHGTKEPARAAIRMFWVYFYRQRL